MKVLALTKKPSSQPLIILAGALYDLVAVGPLAIPSIALAYLHLMFWINQRLGLRGERPDFLPVDLLRKRNFRAAFVHTMPFHRYKSLFYRIILNRQMFHHADKCSKTAHQAVI